MNTNKRLVLTKLFCDTNITNRQNKNIQDHSISFSFSIHTQRHMSKNEQLSLIKDKKS